MIFGKIWRSLKAQMNKLANFFWTADPIAQMQYEYDLAVEQLKTGRLGLEQYRALVERVGRQVATNKSRVEGLEAKIKAYLGGDRDSVAVRSRIAAGEEGPAGKRSATADARARTTTTSTRSSTPAKSLTRFATRFRSTTPS